MQYHTRTANVIRKWFSNCGVDFTYVRILKTVFRAGWNENKVKVGEGANPLRVFREVRSAHWWEGVKDLPLHKRKLEGVAQKHSGHNVAWEGPFVIAFGLDWRAMRNECASLAEWKHQHEDTFIRTLSEKWKMPLPAPSPPKIEIVYEPNPPDFCLPQTPLPELLDGAPLWGRLRGP